MRREEAVAVASQYGIRSCLAFLQTKRACEEDEVVVELDADALRGVAAVFVGRWKGKVVVLPPSLEIMFFVNGDEPEEEREEEVVMDVTSLLQPGLNTISLYHAVNGVREVGVVVGREEEEGIRIEEEEDACDEFF